jgi:hypothetical protein
LRVRRQPWIAFPKPVFHAYSLFWTLIYWMLLQVTSKMAQHKFKGGLQGPTMLLMLVVVLSLSWAQASTQAQGNMCVFLDRHCSSTCAFGHQY